MKGGVDFRSCHFVLLLGYRRFKSFVNCSQFEFYWFIIDLHTVGPSLLWTRRFTIGPIKILNYHRWSILSKSLCMDNIKLRIIKKLLAESKKYRSLYNGYFDWLYHFENGAQFHIHNFARSFMDKGSITWTTGTVVLRINRNGWTIYHNRDSARIYLITRHRSKGRLDSIRKAKRKKKRERKRSLEISSWLAPTERLKR